MAGSTILQKPEGSRWRPGEMALLTAGGRMVTCPKGEPNKLIIQPAISKEEASERLGHEDFTFQGSDDHED